MYTAQIIPYSFNYYGMCLYFEISQGDLFLCFSKPFTGSNPSNVNKDYNIVTKVIISRNTEYMEWLISNDLVTEISEHNTVQQTQLEKLYSIGYWFIDPIQNNDNKYINELTWHLKNIENPTV